VAVENCEKHPEKSSPPGEIDLGHSTHYAHTE